MSRLIPVTELIHDHNYDLGETYDIVGRHAYAHNSEKVGTVRDILTDDSGRIRYFVLDVGGWFSAKEVMIPVGAARIEEDGIYFDQLTKEQVKDMSTYTAGQDYTYDNQVEDIQVLYGADKAQQQRTPGEFIYREDDDTYRTPQRLQLLEERLQVNKDRYVAGQVEIGKHVETRTENVTVGLEHEELVIERHPVSEARPVDGAVTLGSESETVRVDLEAERADVSKQAYVTEEVEIGKRTVTEQQTVTETVGREILDVNQSGQVTVQGDAATEPDNRTVPGRDALNNRR
ncbi:DUF2382 domain-containing protein [Deinococcus soli (ex Cha et al. 2016)]|uniref:Uncharacterized protein (TIGR02271 family) n=2 Tax=Deinococcus soli (ex Cha et al. 2016) TaxID=1309411 RepID=A0ACC6KF96_9DEIO|nr:DUF2382 domain-containing protein [Deinococcus soli (ex Cha et al. 2016)]MDR6218059.1 uncharacterized protein (TIGR02271 family) [Deinococcus soli (ex Cha et al. 2016)]MDR6328309.1 uncharacterized protein (TIGR02271 family) [Deinococcus soli (ex Cha et al. 2016)]MDR6751161.1 uncharacterized protein (TIGR02271 family) [Deinococcus soli (ex Cha et al. 2016)]